MDALELGSHYENLSRNHRSWPSQVHRRIDSFPYFGESSGGVEFGPESESVKLLDFKRLGFDLPHSRGPANREEGDDIGEILVHQARYMIFDNRELYTLAYR